MRHQHNPSFSISGDIYYCSCGGCDNEVSDESNLCFFCKEADCAPGHRCQAEGFQGLRRNPYTDQELVVTALQNLARATEYSSRTLYTSALWALDNAGPEEDILATKIVAMHRMLEDARAGGPRKQKYVPQIMQVLNHLDTLAQ